jgi:hypothetical protein
VTSAFDRSNNFALKKALKMEAVCSFKTLVSIYNSTRRYNIKDGYKRSSILVVAFQGAVGVNSDNRIAGRNYSHLGHGKYCKLTRHVNVIFHS